MDSPASALELPFRQFDIFWQALGRMALEQWQERTREDFDPTTTQEAPHCEAEGLEPSWLPCIFEELMPASALASWVARVLRRRAMTVQTDFGATGFEHNQSAFRVEERVE